MKKIGFLSFGHWTPSPQSQTRSGADALLQSIDLAVAAEALGADGAYFRVHHFARQLGSPFPLLAACGAKTKTIEIGTAVIDKRYENPMFPNPKGLLRLEPYSAGLRERIWWGAATNATAEWAAKLGMNLQSSTLKIDESGRPFHVQQAEQIRIFRAAWKEAGHTREPRVSVSRSIFALVDDRDRAYFGHGSESEDQIGFLGGNERAIFGRSYAAEPDILVEQLKTDEAIAEADTLLLTVPNQLGVDYNAHVIEAILKHVAPGLGWR
jgi:alkanesulfonate monooxygenase SsuD/methylene tetrahydromethanopterin reductase-like flavin-dependent oxidoreductase (luciferase family)